MLELGAVRHAARPRDLRVSLVSISEIIKGVARVGGRGRGGHRWAALNTVVTVPNDLNLVRDNHLTWGQIGRRVRLSDLDAARLAFKVVSDLSVDLEEKVVVLTGPHKLCSKITSIILEIFVVTCFHDELILPLS